MSKLSLKQLITSSLETSCLGRWLNRKVLWLSQARYLTGMVLYILPLKSRDYMKKERAPEQRRSDRLKKMRSKFLSCLALGMAILLMVSISLEVLVGVYPTIEQDLDFSEFEEGGGGSMFPQVEDLNYFDFHFLSSSIIILFTLKF